MVTLIKNIKQLAGIRTLSPLLRGKDLSILPSLENAYLIIEDNFIADYGAMQDLSIAISKFKNVIDADGGFVLHAWCDSHTHLLFDGSREDEFVHKVIFLTYASIAMKWG